MLNFGFWILNCRRGCLTAATKALRIFRPFKIQNSEFKINN